MGFGGPMSLGRIQGIRINADASWFVVLFAIVVLLSSDFRGVLDADRGSVAPYLYAVASAFLYFGSILLHELGHAFVARREGIGISGITLWMFGGIARLERDTESAGAEFRIAVAGPVVTALIVLAGLAVGALTEGLDEFLKAAALEQDAAVAPGMYVVAWITFINAAILVFNLLPAYPLDGGRILRSIAWRRTGDQATATRFSSKISRGFSAIFAGLGVYLVFSGDVVGGIWLCVIAWILNSAAVGATAQSRVAQELRDISVRDVMDAEPVAIDEGLTAEEALDLYFLRYRWPWFPVTGDGGHFRGILRWTDIEEIPESERAKARVGGLVADGADGLMVAADSSLEAVLGKEGLRSLGALIAVDPEGRLRGVLTVSGIGQTLRTVFTPAPIEPPSSLLG